MVSIENTIEYQCWDDELPYADYTIACKQVGVRPLWAGSYSALCSAFDRNKAFIELVGEPDEQ